jgi:hypothetical protein
VHITTKPVFLPSCSSSKKSSSSPSSPRQPSPKPHPPSTAHPDTSSKSTSTQKPSPSPSKPTNKTSKNKSPSSKKTGATLIWCNTTPVPTDIKSEYGRRKGTPEIYNNAALEIISKHPEILITDLHALVTDSPTFQPWWKTRDPHFYKPEEQQALGNAVAETIKKALLNPSP